MPRIRPVKNLRQYFMESVAESMHRHDVEVDDHTACYVVDLLTAFSRSERFFDDGEQGPVLKPMALVLAEAAGADRQHKIRALRRVGDVSLFIAGFLGDGLATRLVDIDYYVNLGGSAYAALSLDAGSSIGNRAMTGVFAELSDKFPELVDVLSDLRDDAARRKKDILRWYEVWLRTGSRRAAKLLREHGIEPQQDARLSGKLH